jgi:Flp pilus assembly pilin Flp
MSDGLVDRLTTSLRRRATDEEGQGLTEYALMLLFVSAAAIGVLTILGTSVSNLIQSAANALP